MWPRIPDEAVPRGVGISFAVRVRGALSFASVILDAMKVLVRRVFSANEGDAFADAVILIRSAGSLRTAMGASPGRPATNEPVEYWRGWRRWGWRRRRWGWRRRRGFGRRRAARWRVWRRVFVLLREPNQAVPGGVGVPRARFVVVAFLPACRVIRTMVVFVRWVFAANR